MIDNEDSGSNMSVPGLDGPEQGDHIVVDFPVVGIGASAGGLEALERFFTNLQPATGMAFVIVQHLSPDFESLMDTLLAPRTTMPIHRATHGMQLRPDEVFLMPPKKETIISGDRLLLTDKDASSGLSLPIDRFFRSLAYEAGNRAIGIVLSGTGSDGSRGVVEIHRHGGLVIVQSSDTAKFDGMPRSSEATGVVDLILSPEEMPQALLRHISHPLAESSPSQDQNQLNVGMEAIYTLLRAEYGIDFTYYRPSTVMRRTERRLSLNHAMELSDYVRRLREDPAELNSLYRDLLIGVTKFFRDPTAFDHLGEKVIHRLIETRADSEELRMWCAGCATGEEAYTLAILVQEQMDRCGKQVPVKIFATDVHRASLDFASAGHYSEESLDQLTDARRDRFFQRQGSGYVVSHDLRQMIVFAPHNIIRDAPFTRLDLVTCRNLLIYLQPVAQQKAISLFHFGLRAGGYMFLGPSESPADLQAEFEIVDEHWKIYRKRRDVRLPLDVRLPSLSGGLPRSAAGTSSLTHSSRLHLDHRSSASFHQQIPYEAILDCTIPPSILINESREIVHVFSGAEEFVRMRGGRASFDILDMVDAELKVAISGAMPRALKQKTAVSLHGIRAITSKGEQRITLTVKPIVDPKNDTMMVLISFESIKPVDVNATTDTVSNIDDLSRDRMQTLETELRFTKENLQATIEELETSNEELQATNEELVASNEELQSTNEELHSVNEELYTVNAEYQRKIYELTQLTDDFENLFRSTEVGTIFLDLDLCIRKFTPQIASIFHLVPQDIGRRLTGFSHQIEGLVIEDDLMAVVESEQTIEREVSDKFGNWYLLRVLPYRAKGRSEGVILTMINITKLKQAQASLRSSDMRLEGILEHSPALIFVKDKDGRYLLTNQHCHQKLGVAGAEAIGKTDAELLPEDVARLIRNNDLDVLRQGKAIEFEETVPTANGPRTFLSIKFPLRDPLLGCETVCAIATDITRLKLIEAEQREALQGRDQFLAMLSHELRNPLAAILNSAYLVQTQSESEPFETTVVKNAVSVIDRQSRQMATLLDDLLDISRITQNKFDIRRSVVDVRSTVSDALQAVAPIVKSRNQDVIVDLDPNPLWVWGDQSRLQQVQVNLLANAAKYSPPGKRIWLTQRVIDDEIQILVRDEGNGIPESLIGTIFDMFVQVGDSLDRRDGGMGVGLTLVRSIVELHGGKIEARSGGTDQGSEFEIRLPRSAAPNVAAGSQNGVSKAVAKSNVLLVEDNADSRETLSQLLGLYGCRVSVAATGYEALDIMCEERFDVAIIDIGLPGLTGFDVARRIRSDRRNDGMFLVALTGYGQPADRLQAKEAGFDEHLIKPIMPEHLESLLQS